MIINNDNNKPNHYNLRFDRDILEKDVDLLIDSKIKNYNLITSYVLS